VEHRARSDQSSPRKDKAVSLGEAAHANLRIEDRGRRCFRNPFICKPGLQAISNTAVQIFLRRVGNRVEQEIETAPFSPDGASSCPGLAHIAGHHDRAPELLGELTNEWFGWRVQIGHGEFRAGTAKHVSAAIRFAVPVGYADDQTPLALKRHTVLRLIRGLDVRGTCRTWPSAGRRGCCKKRSASGFPPSKR